MIFAPNAHTPVSPPFFHAILNRVPFQNFNVFLCHSSELYVFPEAKMKLDIAFSRAQAAILRSSGHSVKEIAKLFNITERWVNKWSKRQCFEDKPRSCLEQLCSKINRDKGASLWLNAVPLVDQLDLALNKQECRDSLHLRYNLPLVGLPSQCVFATNLLLATLYHAEGEGL